MPANGGLDKVVFLTDEEVGKLNLQSVGAARGPWWNIMEALHEKPREWAVVARWTTGEDSDELRSSWLRTRFIQRKAGKIPDGLYELKAKRVTVDGYIVGSQLFARFLEPRPEGVVEFAKGIPGPGGLPD